MEAKSLTKESLALTEKKMDMSLDQIIEMSKNKSNTTKNPRVPNKSQRTFNSAPQDKSTSLRRFMNSKDSLRQGALANKRSHFQGNHFPLAKESARKAAVAPFRRTAVPRDRMVNSNRARGGATPQRNASMEVQFSNRNVQHQQQEPREVGNPSTKQKPQTLDALFANLKEQRTKRVSHPNYNHPARHNGGSRSKIPPWARFGK